MPPGVELLGAGGVSLPAAPRRTNGERVDPAQFLSASRVLIVAGKGGVGKTTVSAVLARAATFVGLRTLVIEVEGKTQVPRLFGHEVLTYDELELVPADPATGRGSLHARMLTPDDALVDYLHGQGLHRVSNRLVGSGALDMVATATPGIRDVLVLGKVKQIERSDRYDLIVFDGHAAGHAITFLRSAHGLLDAVSVGPIHAQAREVIGLLTDPSRCQVLLVALPEETPVNELVETAYSLEDEVGVHLGPVVVNGVTPVIEGLDADPEQAARELGAPLSQPELASLRDAAAFRRSRQALEAAQLQRLAEQLPLAQVHLPHRPTAELTLDDLDALAGALLEEIAALPTAEEA